eukprot:SM000003S11008  [mRNA]  locus=s3:289211:293970:+ [translate_table: standard]
MAADLAKRSVVEEQGEYWQPCGYCRSSGDTSTSYGTPSAGFVAMSSSAPPRDCADPDTFASFLRSRTTPDEADLLDRGWRRCGKFLYKPNLAHTCCPPYTIRLHAGSFKPSKEQRRVLARLQRYLSGQRQGQQCGAANSTAKNGTAREMRVGCQMGSTNRHEASALDVTCESPQGADSQTRTAENGADISIFHETCCSKVFAETTVLESPCLSPKSLPRKLDPVKTISEAVDAVVIDVLGEIALPGDFVPPRAVVRPIPAQVKLQEGSKSLEYTCSVALAVAGVLRATRERRPRIMNSSATHEAAEAHCQELPPRKPILMQAGPQLTGKVPFTGANGLAELLAGALKERGFEVVATKGHLNFSRSASWYPRELAASEELQSAGTEGRTSDMTLDLQHDHAGVVNSAASLHGQPLRQAPSAGHAGVPQYKELAVTMARSSFIEEEYKLYKKYQVAVHNDNPRKVTPTSYRAFLVDSPLIPIQQLEDGSGPSSGFGSFHQQYRFDGRLVAVGVVDVLPKCLSSKYLFWDPDFAFLSLGKYSALQEIEWVRGASVACKSLQYYYLGYYIHTCPKMKYKAAYAPSDLLCPLRYKWVPYNLAGPMLDKEPYAVISDALPRTASPRLSTIHSGHDVASEKVSKAPEWGGNALSTLDEGQQLSLSENSADLWQSEEEVQGTSLSEEMAEADPEHSPTEDTSDPCSSFAGLPVLKAVAMDVVPTDLQERQAGDLVGKESLLPDTRIVLGHLEDTEHDEEQVLAHVAARVVGAGASWHP